MASKSKTLTGVLSYQIYIGHCQDLFSLGSFQNQKLIINPVYSLELINSYAFNDEQNLGGKSDIYRLEAST